MTTRTRTIFRRSFFVVQLALLVPIGWFAWRTFLPRNYKESKSEILPLNLAGGPFETLYFAAEHPKGVLIVATGDGGWSGQWEEPVARHAAAAGFAVGGWDCRKFTNTRKFGHAELIAAFDAAASAVRKRAGLAADCPVWYAGWSTGAEWALSAAASPDRDTALAGVIAVAPGTRSRYGLSRRDLLGILPEGPDTYSLASLAPALHGVPVVQFAGALDVLDDTDWISALHPETPHKLVTLEDTTHDMNHADARFLGEFDMALQWTLDHSERR